MLNFWTFYVINPHNISKNVIIKYYLNIIKLKKSIIGISLDNELLMKLDSTRGLVPRSRYVSKILEIVLEDQIE